jgi:hypothetical protein
LPIMWTHGTGAEIMQRIAVPMIGGMVSSTVLTLVVIPVVYAVLNGLALPRREGRSGLVTTQLNVGLPSVEADETRHEHR